DRPAEGGAVFLLVRILLFLARGLLARGLLAPGGFGVAPEHLAVEVVAPGLGRGDDGRGSDLVELRLVVGSDDLVLADRQLRERVAGALLLAGHAAEEIALLPDAIDVDVDRGGLLRAAADVAVARAIGRELHARHRVRELEEVAG